MHPRYAYNQDHQCPDDRSCDDTVEHTIALYGLDQAITRCLQSALGATRNHVPEVRQFSQRFEAEQVTDAERPAPQ